MESDRQQDERVMSIVSAALRLQPEDRESHIRLACGEDRELYSEVAETLDWEQRMDKFMQNPAISLPPISIENFAPPFNPGELVSERFEIIREIGEGAMGIVYEAFDRKRQQRIAIKAAKPGFHRFLSPELESALKVRHPNVCLVNEIHTAETKYGEIDFLTMELLEGQTLSASLSACGKLLPREATGIARQLCSGLAEAHRMGIIHRDLKSGNVILSNVTNGTLRAVITDFGLSSEPNPTGAVCGTPRYIAPELWLGEKASKASDLYALGVILFEMAAGHVSSGDLTGKFRTSQAGLPKNYSRLMEGCLSIEPQKRCDAFEEALQPSYWNEPIWTRRTVLALASGAACTALGGVWLERNRIGNFFHPLPVRRFVALLPWPPTQIPSARPLLSAAIDAIESELSRAESFDPNLFVISPDDSDEPIAHICESVGANLALTASGIPESTRFRLLFNLLDPKTSGVLRQAKIVCATGDIASLAVKAVQVAASLLNVHLPRETADAFEPGTNSPMAFRALQTAEELLKKPNDEGLEKAIENYNLAINTDARYASAYAKLSIAYSRLYELNRDSGTLELVEANAERALQLNPKLVDARLALSAAAEEKGDRKQAFAEIQRALALDPANPRTLLWQGELYARFSRWNEAEKTYIRLRKQRPNYWPAYNDLGYVLTAQGKYQKAIEAFEIATVAAPGSALAFSNLGEIFLKLGDVTQARNNFEKSLKLKPTDLAYSNLAEALRAEGRYTEALASSLQAVKLASHNDQNWLVLADCYDAIPGRRKEARETYRRAAAEVERRLQADSAEPSSWIRLALYRAKVGLSAEAALYLNKAAHLGALDLDSELIRARVLDLLGKRKDALAALAVCFRKGATAFEVSYVRDYAVLRKDPDYTKILQSIQTKSGPL